MFVIVAFVAQTDDSAFAGPGTRFRIWGCEVWPTALAASNYDVPWIGHPGRSPPDRQAELLQTRNPFVFSELSLLFKADVSTSSTSLRVSYSKVAIEI